MFTALGSVSKRLYNAVARYGSTPDNSPHSPTDGDAPMEDAASATAPPSYARVDLPKELNSAGGGTYFSGSTITERRTSDGSRLISPHISHVASAFDNDGSFDKVRERVRVEVMNRVRKSLPAGDDSLLDEVTRRLDSALERDAAVRERSVEDPLANLSDSDDNAMQQSEIPPTGVEPPTPVADTSASMEERLALIAAGASHAAMTRYYIKWLTFVTRRLHDTNPFTFHPSPRHRSTQFDIIEREPPTPPSRRNSSIVVERRFYSTATTTVEMGPANPPPIPKSPHKRSVSREDSSGGLFDAFKTFGWKSNTVEPVDASISEGMRRPSSRPTPREKSAAGSEQGTPRASADRFEAMIEARIGTPRSGSQSRRKSANATPRDASILREDAHTGLTPRQSMHGQTPRETQGRGPTPRDSARVPSVSNGPTPRDTARVAAAHNELNAQDYARVPSVSNGPTPRDVPHGAPTPHEAFRVAPNGPIETTASAAIQDGRTTDGVLRVDGTGEASNTIVRAVVQSTTERTTTHQTVRDVRTTTIVATTYPTTRGDSSALLTAPSRSNSQASHSDLVVPMTTPVALPTDAPEVSAPSTPRGASQAAAAASAMYADSYVGEVVGRSGEERCDVSHSANHRLSMESGRMSIIFPSDMLGDATGTPVAVTLHSLRLLQQADHFRARCHDIFISVKTRLEKGMVSGHTVVGEPQTHFSHNNTLVFGQPTDDLRIRLFYRNRIGMDVLYGESRVPVASLGGGSIVRDIFLIANKGTQDAYISAVLTLTLDKDEIPGESVTSRARRPSADVIAQRETELLHFLKEHRPQRLHHIHCLAACDLEMRALKDYVLADYSHSKRRSRDGAS